MSNTLPTSSQSESLLAVAVWIPILMLIGIGIAVKLDGKYPHFRLRTLLLATTLIAVVLGLLTWMLG
jgi:hypothetical protein